MKIRVEIVVEVDREAYEAEYGSASAAEIREHIRSGAQSAVATDGVVVAGGIIESVEVR